MKIKEWKYNQIISEVASYGDLLENIEVKRDGTFLNQPLVEDGFITLLSKVETLKESEKAVYVNIANTWKTWIPKSCIA